MMIRVLTFDAVGTLIRLHRPPGATYADVATEFGYHLDRERMQRAFRIAWRRLPPPLELPFARPDDNRDWWRQLVESTLAFAGYQVEPFDPYFETLYQTFAGPGIWEPFPEVPALLNELRHLDLGLGIISNFDRRLYRVLDHLNIRNVFSHVIISSEVGADKPSPRIFLEAARRFGVKPEAMLHVGDDPELDGEGARSAGIESLVINHQSAVLRDIFSRVGGHPVDLSHKRSCRGENRR